MEVIPAIDLLGDGAVRLRQGDYDRVTAYGEPAALAAALRRRGRAAGSTSSTSTVRAREASSRGRERGGASRFARAGSGFRRDPLGRGRGGAAGRGREPRRRRHGGVEPRSTSSSPRSASGSSLRSTCATASCAPAAGPRAALELDDAIDRCVAAECATPLHGDRARRHARRAGCRSRRSRRRALRPAGPRSRRHPLGRRPRRARERRRRGRDRRPGLARRPYRPGSTSPRAVAGVRPCHGRFELPLGNEPDDAERRQRQLRRERLVVPARRLRPRPRRGFPRPCRRRTIESVFSTSRQRPPSGSPTR